MSRSCGRRGHRGGWGGEGGGAAAADRGGGGPPFAPAGAGAPPPRGTPVIAAVDWDRRHTLMRTHTALHVLSAIVWRDYGAKVTGGNMEPGEARMDFELDSMSAEFGREVQEKLNRELSVGDPREPLDQVL